jgi:hypothetical protein
MNQQLNTIINTRNMDQGIPQITPGSRNKKYQTGGGYPNKNMISDNFRK